ncbi:glycoside hydrolase family 105 protein [Flammeovirga sp. EKP202]|uniref:glycoside hydrolase family 88/105 protein n=1 Tax=Flammeovirga sp. EKP202 TaxID=2770592 RepID=UPI00165FB093|nr:glycoside hydrolase family 88 protein [Flammeovirga sp. EKP202]MBD0401738.1 glycoside hydrolase family 88 protein [Flammeovirga sp. EKP202]
MIFLKNYIYITFAFVVVGLDAYSQDKTDENTNLFRIANDVVEQTTLTLPLSDSNPQPSRYNAWMYQNYMLIEAMDALYEATKNEKYKEYANLNIDYFATYQASFGDVMTNTPSGKQKWYSQPTEMWQCGMIAKYPERQIDKPNQEFERGMEIFDSLLNNVPSFDDGTLVRVKKPNLGLGLQIDDLYMIAPYWCRKAVLTNKVEWLDRAIEESLHYYDYLWNEESELMKCLWLQNTGSVYGHYWGRGNGWYILAITDLLEFIPEDHPKKALIMADYTHFMKGIIKYQDKDGLWHQLLDHPESFSESSCSGMFTYCILKGVNEGWLDPEFMQYGIKGWQGLQSKVNSDFQITDVCPPTGMSDDVDYYLKRERIVHDQHAIGPYILAGAEYLKATKHQ